MQNYALVKEVELLASKKGVTPGQLALAWVHSQGDDVFPIPGKAISLQGFGASLKAWLSLSDRSCWCTAPPGHHLEMPW